MMFVLEVAVFVVLLVGIALIALLIEDRRYPAYVYESFEQSQRRALLLTWQTDDQDALWQQFEQAGLQETLSQLQSDGMIEWVIPLDPKTLKHREHSSTWSACTLMLFEEVEDATALAVNVLAQVTSTELANNIAAADLLCLQGGLDLFYPKTDGLAKEARLHQTAEYVFSDPAHRSNYYAEQYLWSGPAMADLHSRDKAGRFIGFEAEQRLFAQGDMPEWDLFHLVGFTRWQTLKSIPFFLSTWNRHAKRAFGPDMSFRKKLEDWGAIRLNIKSSARQIIPLTLQSPRA